MTDITLTPVTTGYNIGILNDNLEVIEEVINGEVLHTEGGNNTMNQPLDMNSFPIINYQTDDEDPTSLASVQFVLDTLGTTEGIPALEEAVEDLEEALPLVSAEVEDLKTSVRDIYQFSFSDPLEVKNLTEDESVHGFYRFDQGTSSSCYTNLQISDRTPSYLVFFASNGGNGSIVIDDPTWPSAFSVKNEVLIVDKWGTLLYKSGDVSSQLDAAKKQSFVIACSDETTEVISDTNVATFRVPYDFRLTEIRASLTTATTSPLDIMVKANGSDVLDTELYIDSGDKSSLDTNTSIFFDSEPYFDLTSDDEITIDIVTGGADATGLKVTLLGYNI